ncbi:hypothetical protein CASFOL_034092 [Castilleja foliolosa]|uniref:SWIRM domain-containing protein n=1 Tax=Castilleja foliolosa TaxID=1961234 RepID=A0ABD3BY77_9LAMI
MSSSSGRAGSVAAGDLQLVTVAERSPVALPPRPPSSSSSALVEYTPHAANPEDEDLEIKLLRIIDCVPVRVNNTSGTSAGSGYGDFHQFVPEFFDGRSSSKNPRAYKYYRNAIIRHFRENPNRKITFTEVRKTIVGDVGSIRRVFDFLEAWGLINYVGSTKPQLKWEDKETKSAASAAAQGGDSAADGPHASATKRRSAMAAILFHDITLCARCYVRGNYMVGLSSLYFKRIEISEETKTDWRYRKAKRKSCVISLSTPTESDEVLWWGDGVRGCDRIASTLCVSAARYDNIDDVKSIASSEFSLDSKDSEGCTGTTYGFSKRVVAWRVPATIVRLELISAEGFAFRPAAIAWLEVKSLGFILYIKTFMVFQKKFGIRIVLKAKNRLQK